MLQRCLVVALLALLFFQAVTALPKLSQTADEPVYIGAGYAFLHSGDLRMATSAQHPPLMQELVALPLLLQPGPDLDELEGWSSAEMVRFAAAFVAWYGDALDAATFAARMPVVWITLLWAALLYRWAADWFGPWGGVVALTLFVLDPNVLAHATLATNDVGFAAFSFMALFAATRFLRRQSRRYLLLTGLALGASLSSKSSGFFTALVLATLFPLAALPGGEGRARRVARAVLHLALIVGLGLLVLWATYGFELRPLEGGRWSVPLATQWEVWREMRQHLSTGHTGYLMGQVRDTGWRVYYPLAFALKTPPLTLALLALGLATAVAGGPRRWRAMLPLWVYLGGYTASTLMSTVSTGYRFLLPVLPFCFLLIAGLFRHGAAWLRKPRLRWGSWAVLLALGLLVAGRSHPHYLTYFNFLVGGPAGGHRYLVDSNLDWGQSFNALRAYMDEREIEQVWLSYYTYADPALYGVRYRPIAPSPGAEPLLSSRFDPAPGIYAISATTLQGVMVVDPDIYSWFRQREPLARPGTALFVYQVERTIPQPTWLAQCTHPAVPLTPQVVAEGFGRDDLRLAYFDCQQSWLYPTGGHSPGWYALHRDAALGDDDLFMGEMRLSYEQRTDRQAPAFAIYEQPVTPSRPGPCAADPLPLEGPLDFLGHTLPDQPARPGETVEIETCWQVTARPARPLSLMAHLVGPGNTPALVGDGLGVPPETWQAGDVIVQRHRLTLPPDAPGGDYALYVGAYWLDSMERWSTSSGAQLGAAPSAHVRVVRDD
jgi:4-amino-4-deoxy-L-arabinose transferase-like glycosyltransferase